MKSQRPITPIILISGIDGSGKTTIARLVTRLIRIRGYPVLHVWLRYPRLTSVIPLVLSRIMGLTIKIKRNSLCSYTYHLYKAVPTLGILYEITILFDYIIYKLLKVWIPNKIGFTIIVDRSLLDIIVDIYIETGSAPRLLLRYLSRDLKEASRKIVVLASVAYLMSRRRDNLCNPYLRHTLKLYEVLAPHYSYSIFINDSLEDLKNIVYFLIKDFQPIRVYANPSNQLLKALYYRHRWLIYVSNFIFQSMGYMWKIEVLFRVAIQIALIVSLIVIGFHPFVALIVSHTMLYLFYSNIFALEKWTTATTKPIKDTEIRTFFAKLNKIERLAKRYSRCFDIVIVGSLARDPNIIFKKKIDLDLRIVPRHKVLCVMKSLAFAMYLRLWALVNKFPLDLYVKSHNDLEFSTQHTISLTELMNLLKKQDG